MPYICKTSAYEQTVFRNGPGEACDVSMVVETIREIVEGNGAIYTDLLYQLVPGKKELLLAINREGKAEAITSGKFIKKHSLQRPSTVQNAAKALVDRQIVTFNQIVYQKVCPSR